MAAPADRRFAYYDRLSAERKRIYRRSDAIGEVPLRHVRALAAPAGELRAALEGGEVTSVQRAAGRLTRALLADLGAAAAVDVEVLETRPRGDYGELHGLYTYEDGERPRIQVWMRTAARGRVVAWKTFLRTLLHEVMHHLDIHWFDLEETFHTRGFYRRENHLFDQIHAQVPPQRPVQRDDRQPVKPPKGQLSIPGF